MESQCCARVIGFMDLSTNLLICTVIDSNNLFDALSFGNLLSHRLDVVASDKAVYWSTQLLRSCEGAQRAVVEYTILLFEDCQCGLQALPLCTEAVGVRARHEASGPLCQHSFRGRKHREGVIDLW